MTLWQVLKICAENNIPSDATLRIDSGWTHTGTDIKSIYYQATTNTVVLVQDVKDFGYNATCTVSGEVDPDPSWVEIYPGKEV